MNPDSPETRIGRLETSVARLNERTEDLRGDVRDLMPLLISVAEMRGAMTRVQTDLQAMSLALTKLTTDGERAQIAALQDSKKWRRTMTLALISTLGAVLGAAAVVIAAV